MINNKQEFSFKFGDKEITIETGRLAKQADGAVLVTSGGTQVLVTACSAREVNDSQDFFPLMVDYKEKFFAGGKFLGGFFKREGRPGNHEILLMRIIDRPLRPLFPEGYMFETIIMAQVLSYDEEHDPEILAGLGASAALAISDIPFNGPLGFCRVGKINNEFVLNPSHEEIKKSEMEIMVAASDKAVLMVEGEAKEVSEEDMLGAINFAHDSIKIFCAKLNDMVKKVGKTKRAFESAAPNKKLIEQVEKDFIKEARACLAINPKLERQEASRQLQLTIKEALALAPEKFGLTEDSSFSKEARKATEELLYKIMRADIINDDKRIGGRKLDEIRPIETEVNLLKKVHGSSLFTRGETQVLAAVTIGGKDGEQMSDRLSGIFYDKFYLHYTFAPYSVGEARGYRGVGRREVGHGNLAERALKVMLPTELEFPYTVRLACEVTESNGSSSMGSVCSGSMAMMDAGIPLYRPVAGIAMGLIKEGDKFKILSDILGDEDALGDMDFKLAGTEKGITAIQIDIKITGLDNAIMKKALSQAKTGRLHILKEMAKTISSTRGQFKAGVPTIVMTKIDKDRIGALIGPGGKNIKGLQEKYSVTIDISEEGDVKILSADSDINEKVKNLINMQINGPAIGSDYQATVQTIKEYGAFVEIADGVSGLVHISEITDARVNDANEYLAEGDVVTVRVLDIDRFGKIKLSIKAVKPMEKK
ncbi:MAG: polyribonucleotide nucleotidyltransferase [Bacteriovoracaceae bacterium]|nr:polyribonucleotide nucleotidyltransferase [Bacteriovoracaceae bacterium]